MSITFQIGVLDTESNWVKPAERCDCSRRWCDECDRAYDNDRAYPDMYTCEICDAQINMSNANAIDLLGWLGLTVDDSGDIPAQTLAPILRRRLWDENRNHDAALTNDQRAQALGVEPTARVITCGREAGYLRGRCEQLLAVCERAGDRLIYWA